MNLINHCRYAAKHTCPARCGAGPDVCRLDAAWVCGFLRWGRRNRIPSVSGVTCCSPAPAQAWFRPTVTGTMWMCTG